MNYLQNANYSGITGGVSFNKSGLRKNSVLSLYNVFNSRMAIIGNWTRTAGIAYFYNGDNTLNETGSMERTLTITTVLAAPYMELVTGLSSTIEDELRAIEPSGNRKIYPNSYFTVSIN